MRRRAEGFTLVELLVASSVLVALLAALGSLFVSSSRAYESNRGASSAAANLRSAVHALRYDVSMAGFRGLDGDAAEREIVTPLVVTLAGADVTNDSSWPIAEITARFVETRYTQGAPTVREVTYRVRNGALERREGADGAYVVIAAGIARRPHWPRPAHRLPPRDGRASRGPQRVAPQPAMMKRDVMSNTTNPTTITSTDRRRGIALISVFCSSWRRSWRSALGRWCSRTRTSS